jgi:hypothetical protein
MYAAFGVLGGLGMPELIVIVFVFGVVMLVPKIFYLLTLQRALDRCALESRTLSPGLVWLMLIPLFSLVWDFIVVNAISKSLHNEFVRRNMPHVELEPGRGIGLAMCILYATSIIPFIGILTGIAGVICWIVYWVKISEYARLLAPTVRWSGPLPGPGAIV